MFHANLARIMRSGHARITRVKPCNPTTLRVEVVLSGCRASTLRVVLLKNRPHPYGVEGPPVRPGHLLYRGLEKFFGFGQQGSAALAPGRQAVLNLSNDLRLEVGDRIVGPALGVTPCAC
jgi:hypothetical protein